jgi:hypothetical protein
MSALWPISFLFLESTYKDVYEVRHHIVPNKARDNYYCVGFPLRKSSLLIKSNDWNDS